MLGLARGRDDVRRASRSRSWSTKTLLVLARDPQKDGIALRVQVQPDLTVNGDPVQLEQVLLNLLINARQAMLGTRRIDHDQGRATSTATRELRIQVIDTGPGIPEKLPAEDLRAVLHDQGHGQKGETKGTGLGLAICKEIVEHHKGRIEVQSEVGKGTTFGLVLPRGERGRQLATPEKRVWGTSRVKP